MGINLKAGDKIPLRLLLENRATGRVVRALIRDDVGAEIVGSPFNVPEILNGYHGDDSVSMPDVAHITVEYDVFDGPLFTNLSGDLFPEVERFDLDDLATDIQDLTDLINANRKADLVGKIEPPLPILGIAGNGEIFAKILPIVLKGVVGDTPIKGNVVKPEIFGEVNP